MKKIFKLIPAALALVAFASCSSDDLFNEKAASQAVDGKTMEASIESFNGTSTRTAFAENKNDAGKADARALVWTAGDSYKVYGELATPDMYTLQNASAGMINGTFDLMTEDYNNNPAFAVFPYDKVEADRASSKLTVTLTDWTYSTAQVKEEGYNQGGFVSNVPMFGKITSGNPKNAQFGYMTSILRIDLAKLPKQTSRLIIITDRPLTGTFETEFEVDGAYPEIKSPIGNEDQKQTITIDGADITNYIMAIGTTPENKRTNKTFFVAVPTGNKYNTFDIYVEYNMAGSTQTELVASLGNTDRLLAGKSILDWKRGKVKSLSKEITVTANGNTPKALSQFLKNEWKTFPAGAEINITVADATGNLAPINNSNVNPGDNIFTIPAEFQGTVNIIVDPSVGEGYTESKPATYALVITDEDKAPVASAPLRKINFCVATSSAKTPQVLIDAPESKISLTAPEGFTAEYNAIGTSSQSNVVSYGDAEDAGLYIGEGVTTTSINLLDGSLECEATDRKSVV